MSKADILLKRAALFEKMAQEVLPLTDLPGQMLQVDPNTGGAYYASSTPPPKTPPSSPGASGDGSAPAPTPTAQAPKPKPAPAKQPNVPPEWLRKYMEQERMAEWAQGEIARLKAENDALKAKQGQPPKA